MISEEGMFGMAHRLLPKEEMLATRQKKSTIKIGVLAEKGGDESRVCLTPDSVALLVENGHEVFIQNSAGAKAGYNDMSYSENGGKISSTLEEVMQADVVLKVSPLNSKERTNIQKNQVLITSLPLLAQSRDYFESMVDKKAIGISFERIKDSIQSFALIRSMSEIVGTTGIQIASYYLSHPDYGNGTMLGGVPGVRPAEVVIIGAGTVGEYAVRAAIGMGASVKVFDNHIYKLRRLQNNIKQNVFTSTIQPQVLQKALQSADVVIGALRSSDNLPINKIPSYMVEGMKRKSVIIDVSIDQGGTFETSRPTTHQDPIYEQYGVTHYCVTNIASRVPYTASNALSNFFAPLLLEMSDYGGISEYLKKDIGVRNGVYVYNGIVTDSNIGRTFGFNYRDLALLLAVLQ